MKTVTTADSCPEHVVVCDETVRDVRLGIVFLFEIMLNVNQRILCHVKMYSLFPSYHY